MSSVVLFSSIAMAHGGGARLSHKGPHKTLYNHWTRWSDKGIFARMFVELAKPGEETDTLRIDATHLKAHRTAASLRLKKGAWSSDHCPSGDCEAICREGGLTKGGHDPKLPAVAGGLGRPIRLFMTAGQRSDHSRARAFLEGMPPAEHRLADRGYDYDVDRLRSGLKETRISLCIPSRKNCKDPIPHDAERCKSRHKVEVMFGRLKDWRRVATRYNRSPMVFLSALAALVIFWL